MCLHLCTRATINGWMDERTDGWMVGRVDGRGGWMHTCTRACVSVYPSVSPYLFFNLALMIVATPQGLVPHYMYDRK